MELDDIVADLGPDDSLPCATLAEDDAAIARHIADAVQAVLDAPPDTDHLADVASRFHWGVHEEALLRAIHRPS